MSKYTAPQAQTVIFHNDYVMAKNQNKSWSKGCEYSKDEVHDQGNMNGLRFIDH